MVLQATYKVVSWSKSLKKRDRKRGRKERRKEERERDTICQNFSWASNKRWRPSVIWSYRFVQASVCHQFQQPLLLMVTSGISTHIIFLTVMGPDDVRVVPGSSPRGSKFLQERSQRPDIARLYAIVKQGYSAAMENPHWRVGLIEDYVNWGECWSGLLAVQVGMPSGTWIVLLSPRGQMIFFHNNTSLGIIFIPISPNFIFKAVERVTSTVSCKTFKCIRHVCKAVCSLSKGRILLLWCTESCLFIFWNKINSKF